jgi:four helix bundle protein
MDAPKRDLVERTFVFAQHVREFVNRLPRTIANFEDGRQLVRSSGSVAANYLEAQEGLSRKDFFFRIRLCRKEARESALWLRLVNAPDSSDLRTARDGLVGEADELKRIFAAIANRDDRDDPPSADA